jgi:hypothetical protein
VSQVYFVFVFVSGDCGRRPSRIFWRGLAFGVGGSVTISVFLSTPVLPSNELEILAAMLDETARVRKIERSKTTNPAFASVGFLALALSA